MMKIKSLSFCFLCPIFFNLGCSDKGDLEQFVTDTKKKHTAHIAPLKAAPQFEHFDYSGKGMRSPYVLPVRKLTEEVVDRTKNCLQPELNRQKTNLETYALDNLKMRGSLTDPHLGAKPVIWALIETHDGQVHRLSVGDYLGLYHGEIAVITETNIEIIELIPDGGGCWTHRSSHMALVDE
ncbi:pilus assembly protein PilP [Shewanella surugensis]|uniref:Pilus assembly protein PilP n=1 Tax=Shewanella surugensis TaxID=212020 RepID=A0ABT0LE10_9GAMM|nr:pilus assembly protein PilP [Shewanella surugensis]MCL1125562.1 pilus assembly protein PilP [Shewanella surugensis]